MTRPSLTPAEVRAWAEDLRTRAASGTPVENLRAIEGYIHAQALLAIAQGRAVLPQRCAEAALLTYTVSFERHKVDEAAEAVTPPAEEATPEHPAE